MVQKAYDSSFRSLFKFSIGQSLVTASIELLMNLLDARYQARNAGSLAAAVREVNRIRYLMRLAKDPRVVNLAAHEFAATRRQSGHEVKQIIARWTPDD